jgi:hypothetical protein
VVNQTDEVQLMRHCLAARGNSQIFLPKHVTLEML